MTANHAGIPELVGALYEQAPAHERSKLLAHLMRPLGALSLVGIANGVFARIWFRHGWGELDIVAEDTMFVGPADVMELARYTEQVSMETIDAVGQLISSSPVLAGTSVAAMVIAAIMARRSKAKA